MAQVIHNYISLNEQKALQKWANENYLPVRNQPDDLLKSTQNAHRKPTSGERLSKLVCKDNAPAEFFDIQKRMVADFGLQDRVPTTNKQGKVIVHKEDSETPAHIDYYEHLGPGFYRMIAKIQSAEVGGELIVDGETIDLPERSIVIFDASKSHEVTLVEKGTRIVYAFGWKD